MARLEFGKKIGYGQFCVVHEAWVVTDDGKRTGPLAVKRMQKEAAKHSELRSRFQREGRLLGDVLNHPNIVSVVLRDTNVARPYLVMPKADSNLSARIDAGDCGSEDWTILIFRQILEAVAYAHDRNVIHRDLKPRNVLLHRDTVKVTDFGTGKELEQGDRRPDEDQRLVWHRAVHGAGAVQGNEGHRAGGGRVRARQDPRPHAHERRS